MKEFFAVLLSTIVGAGVFAAGAWFRHRYIKPEPPACLPREGNPWVLPATNEEQGEGWK